MPVIRVLPILDLNTGQLQFSLSGQWVEFYTRQPEVLFRTLARSTTAPTFDPDTAELVLRTPAQHQPDGARVTFQLEKFLEPSLVTRLEGDDISLAPARVAPTVPDTARTFARGESLL